MGNKAIIISVGEQGIAVQTFGEISPEEARNLCGAGENFFIEQSIRAQATKAVQQLLAAQRAEREAEETAIQADPNLPLIAEEMIGEEELPPRELEEDS